MCCTLFSQYSDFSRHAYSSSWRTFQVSIRPTKSAGLECYALCHNMLQLVCLSRSVISTKLLLANLLLHVLERADHDLCNHSNVFKSMCCSKSTPAAHFKICSSIPELIAKELPLRWQVHIKTRASPCSVAQGLLEFLAYEPFYHSTVWRSLLHGPLEGNHPEGSLPLRSLMQGVMLRRTKAHVGQSPPITCASVYIHIYIYMYNYIYIYTIFMFIFICIIIFIFIFVCLTHCSCEQTTQRDCM